MKMCPNKFIMGVLAQAKVATNSFGNRNFIQPMDRLKLQ
jgi:hypothetical protein